MVVSKIYLLCPFLTYLLENGAFLLILFKRLEATTFVTPGSVNIFCLTPLCEAKREEETSDGTSVGEADILVG